MMHPSPRHARFLQAFALGLAVGAAAFGLSRATGGQIDMALVVLAGGNAFFLTYLILNLRFARSITPAKLRTNAAREDEGLGLILALAAFAVATSLTAIFTLVNRPGGLSWTDAALAFVAVPLGWSMVHSLASVHYAHLYYGPGGAGPDDRGLAFPGTDEPGMWDFLYLGFGIGMTAQVADVSVTNTAMRRAVMVHCIASFFNNTIILALAVNAALAGG